MSLIDAQVLADHLEEADLVVCDVRFYLADHQQGRREYDAGHVPGAHFVDLHTELAGGPGGGRHPLPLVTDFAALLGRLGVREHSLVVAYDDAGGAMAARLWWMLRSINHRRAAVLDGGWSTWLAARHPVETATPSATATNYPTPKGWTGIVDASEVQAAIEAGVTVLDARAPERYRGDTEPIDPRAGHIPGARNHFHASNRRPDGTHRPARELADMFAGVSTEPIVYCGSGVSACADLLAMEIAGITDARLYPGSWSEWCAGQNRPVATGP